MIANYFARGNSPCQRRRPENAEQNQLLELPMTGTSLTHCSVRPNPWGWACCCSLLAHVVFLLLLVSYLHQTRPQRELITPMRVNLVTLPQKLAPQLAPTQIIPPRQTRQAKPQPTIRKQQVPPKKIKKAAQALPPPAPLVREPEMKSIIAPKEQAVKIPRPASYEAAPQTTSMHKDSIALQNIAQTALLERLKQNYAAQIRERINQAKRYPLIARKRGKEGTVALEFSLDAQGMLLDSRIRESCGTNILDRAALKALADANPFSRPPTELATKQTFQLQIHFALKN